MQTKKLINSQPERKTALCYVRQSFTRDADDTASPERQRANIQAACDRNGWTPEWYEDAQGHKSARSEKNRPQWLALKSRLSDPDVVALVANDLARLHRKGWRVGDMIDYLNEYGVNLVLAAPGREVDTTTMKGRMFLQFGAIIDEYYAEDISQRAKDSIAYRKGLGKSVGTPPFGTMRNKEGYLIPDTRGAWLLSTGQLVGGHRDSRPHDATIWHGYCDAVYRVLTLYAEGDVGLEKIAYAMNADSWAFQDRNGEPRPFDRDDIRRIIANWPEYGGMLGGARGKDRPAYEKLSFDDIPFNPERAIFPIPLLRTVAQIRKERSVRPVDRNVKRLSHPYSLSGILYCAHCERAAQKHGNSKPRSVISGNTTSAGELRYRHKLGVKCDGTVRSVACQVVEQDLGRLFQALTVRPEAQETLARLAMEMDTANGQSQNPDELEKEKAKAIALCRRRIDATVVLFGDGMIDRDEYQRRVEYNIREIAHWQSRTTETQKVALELAMCIEAVDRLDRLWKISDDEDKQGLARSLFTEIMYDLDNQRIVGFKLKPWADRFLTVRAMSYTKEENGTNSLINQAGIVDGNVEGASLLGGIQKPTDHSVGFCFSGSFRSTRCRFHKDAHAINLHVSSHS